MSVPELRFPEFTGEWEEKSLGNICQIKKSKYNPEKEKISFKCIELEHISQNTGQILGFCESKEQKSIKNRFEKGDVLFGKLRPYLKKYWFAKFDGVCSGEIWVFEGNEVSNKFLFNLIQTDKFNYIANISSGSKMPRSDWTYMHNVNFYIPSIPEQEKIASFLSAVDEKIEKLEKKLELWEAYKKGMMQKIFSQELAFKDENGEDYPKWEDKRLKDFVTIPKKEKLSNVDNETLLTVKLHCKGIEANYGIQPKITKRGRPYFKRNAGEFLIGRQNFHNGGMGIVPAELDGFISSNAITSLKINEEKVIKRYLLYYLSRRDYYKKTVVIMGGTGQKEISEKNILNLDVKTPILNEQRKIAKFLLNIENKIVLLNQKLEISINFKKGLSQKMFY